MLGELIEEGSPITLNAGDQPLAESSDQKVSGLTGMLLYVVKGLPGLDVLQRGFGTVVG